MAQEKKPGATELSDADLDQIHGGDKAASVKATPPKPVPKDPDPGDRLGNFEIQDLMN